MAVVLAVDDSPVLSGLLARALRAPRRVFISAVSNDDALAKGPEILTRVSLVISDDASFSLRRLAAAIQRGGGAASLIITTAPSPTACRIEGWSRVRVIPKPWDLKYLREQVSLLLGSHQQSPDQH